MTSIGSYDSYVSLIQIRREMRIQLIQVPYDSGHRGIRMGRGPEHFITQGADQRLRQHGHDVEVVCIKTTDSFPAEIVTTFTLHQVLAECVKTAINQGQFPLVLSGNCNSCIGTLAGMQQLPTPVGIIWFDGHGDFHTPETSTSGFLDGMGMAMATGRCWQAMLQKIPGFRPVSEDHVVLVGAREFDPEELANYRQSNITLVEAQAIRQQGREAVLNPVLAALRSRVEQIYVHLDLDVLDPGEAKANEFAPPEGLTVKQVATALQRLKQDFTVSASTIASYDPSCDTNGSVFEAGVTFMEILGNAGVMQAL